MAGKPVDNNRSFPLPPSYCTPASYRERQHRHQWRRITGSSDVGVVVAKGKAGGSVAYARRLALQEYWLRTRAVLPNKETTLQLSAALPFHVPDVWYCANKETILQRISRRMGKKSSPITSSMLHARWSDLPGSLIHWWCSIPGCTTGTHVHTWRTVSGR